jgi:hypothetical protein
MFCARVKITLDVLALQIFLFSEKGWIGLSGYGIPNSALLILRFASVDSLPYVASPPNRLKLFKKSV